MALSSVQRLLGCRGSHDAGGPLVLVIGGVHGNEPGGVLASHDVLAELESRRIPVAGRVVFLTGNLAALQASSRYVDVDLNRLWTDEQIAAMRARDPSELRAEDREQRELLELIERELAPARGRVVVLDLHSTSAGGAPFAIIGDTLGNRAIAFALEIPVILGLEENIHGTLLEYFGNRGHVAVGFEGGQHQAATTRQHHAAAIWVTLVTAGVVRRKDVQSYDEHVARLVRVGQDLPRVVEILHRHDIAPDEVFQMNPGYENFQRVERGELLARADPGRREVRAPRGGWILMPLYQSKGRDGFFLGRTVRPFWLALSAWLRRAKLDDLFARLPGLLRRPGEPGVLEVDARIARFFTVQVFHLLGYRRCEQIGARMIFTRRVEASAARR